MADHPASWLEDIMLTAGPVSPATASAIRQAAENTYTLGVAVRGEAWAQYDARQTAQSILARIATNGDPDVQAAFRRYEDAVDREGRLLAAVGGTATGETPERLAAAAVGRVTKDLHQKYAEIALGAAEWHHIAIGQAWRAADIDFAESHRDELQAADPQGYEAILENATQDSWRREILRAAGDVSPLTVTQIQRAAEHAYQQSIKGPGDAWGRYAARQAAKDVLTQAATASDPVVQAAFQAATQAQGHAEMLIAAAVGTDLGIDLNTAEGRAAREAAGAAARLADRYIEAAGTAAERYHTAISRAWLTADTNFAASHRDELAAANPGLLKNIREDLTDRAAKQAMPDPDRPPGDDAPGNVREHDQVRDVQTGQLATIVRVWAYGDETGVTVQYDGRDHLDNGGPITWWQRATAAVNARWQARTALAEHTAPGNHPGHLEQELTTQSADPCTVTGHFVSNIGPTLHYTLTSAAGHVLDYWRDPVGHTGAQVKAGDRWLDLARQDPRYQAVIEGVRAHEARQPDLAGYNNPQAERAAGQAAGDAPGGMTRPPVTIALSQLRLFERTAPDGRTATARFRRGQQLQPGDVISGQRDPWAVVTHVTGSGPDIAIRVQEAGGSRTMTSGSRGPGFDVRADLRVDPSTCPDIPDGFPPRWGVWRTGAGQSQGTLAWFPEPGQAAQHARQASRDGGEYAVELEAPDGTWTEVDAYQQGRRNAWGTRLAAGQGKTAVPPWATPIPGPTLSADPDAPGALPGQSDSAAPRLAASQEFTGPVGAPLSATSTPRPAGSTPSTGRPTRPRSRP